MRKNNIRMTLRMDEETEKQLTKLAVTANMSRSQVISELIQNGQPLTLQQNHSDRERAEKLRQEKEKNADRLLLDSARYLARIKVILRMLNTNFNQIAKYANRQNLNYRIAYKEIYGNLNKEEVKNYQDPETQSTYKVFCQLKKFKPILQKEENDFGYSLRDLRETLGLPRIARGTNHTQYKKNKQQKALIKKRKKMIKDDK